MKTGTAKFRWAARAGLLLGPLAWGLNQQVTSTLVYAHCEKGNATLTLTTGIVCALIAAIGLYFSASARRVALRAREQPESATSPFIATLSIMMASFTLLVIAVATAAGFFLPGCYQ